MLYDQLVQPGEYLCHHGVKGQKWGIRRFRDSQIFKKNREAYKKRISTERKQSKDKQQSFVNERNDIIKSHFKSAIKGAIGGTVAGGLTGLGAAAVGGLIGGPTGAIATSAIANAGSITLAALGTAQSVAMWANTISRARTLSEVYKR